MRIPYGSGPLTLVCFEQFYGLKASTLVCLERPYVLGPFTLVCFEQPYGLEGCCCVVASKHMACEVPLVLPCCCFAALQVDELLRHLWGLLPCNTTEKINKMERIQVCYLPDVCAA